MQVYGIDEKDNLIVNLLMKDGRMSYSDIADKIGLTRTAVKNRIRSLENREIISGYRAVINPLNSPEMTPFIVNIETTAEAFETARDELKKSEKTVTLLQTTGNCHLVAVCVASDLKSMRIFVNKVYKEIPGILSINAHAVLDVIKGSVIPEN